jgi:hypothetical protein
MVLLLRSYAGWRINGDMIEEYGDKREKKKNDRVKNIILLI